MSTIDQFESVFRSAVKPTYEPSSLHFEKVLVVTDLAQSEHKRYREELEPILKHLCPEAELSMTSPEVSSDVSGLIQEIEKCCPHLVITHRHLHSSQQHSYTLGDHIEVLTQLTEVPILLFPHHSEWRGDQFRVPDRVMVLTDQLEDHPQLIDAALSIVQPQGLISLAHIEDEAQFNRYMGFISKIPEIDTETARSSLKKQIVKEAEDFVKVIAQTLEDQELGVSIHSDIRMGHQLKTYVSMVELNRIDMVVMQSKDDDQIAIHGLSYPLAVEVSSLPLLIL